MKKRKLLLLSFVSIATMILSMTSCKGKDNPNPDPKPDDPIVTPEVSLEAVSITNKEALKTIEYTDEDVQKWCDNKKSSTKTYKGWDGCEYPYYEATAVNILNVEGE